MSLSLQHEIFGKIDVLVLSGEVDLSTLPRLTDALNKSVLQDAPVVALDLEMVTVLDDAALGIILGVASRLRQMNRRLILVCGNERIVRYLEMTGVTSLVSVYQALSSFTFDSAE